MRVNRYMDIATLNKGNELTDRMERVIKEIKGWEIAAKWSDDGVLSKGSKNETIWTKGGPNTFEIVKTLSLAYWTKELEALKIEFEALKPGQP